MRASPEVANVRSNLGEWEKPMELLIQAVGFGVALPLVLWLSQRLVPYTPPPGVHPYMLHVLRPIYARWDKISLVLAFVFIPLLAYTFYEILVALAKLQMRQFDSAPYVLSPFWVMWAIPAGFLAILAANVPLVLILNHFLQDKVAEYLVYLNLSYGYDTQRLGKIVFNIVGLLSAIFLLLAYDSYVVFDNSEIIISEFFSLSDERYHYTDIRAIEVERIAPHGNLSRVETHYVIAFKNGKRWYSRLSPIESEDGRLRSAMEFVSSKSGVPIPDLPVK